MFSTMPLPLDVLDNAIAGLDVVDNATSDLNVFNNAIAGLDVFDNAIAGLDSYEATIQLGPVGSLQEVFNQPSWVYLCVQVPRSCS